MMMMMMSLMRGLLPNQPFSTPLSVRSNFSLKCAEEALKTQSYALCELFYSFIHFQPLSVIGLSSQQFQARNPDMMKSIKAEEAHFNLYPGSHSYSHLMITGEVWNVILFFNHDRSEQYPH